MKILYISEAVIPSQSANSIAILHMCNGLAKNNEVTLICLEGESNKDIFEYYGVSKNDNLNVIRIQKSNKRKINQIKIIIKGLLEKNKYDIVYTRWIQMARIITFWGKECIVEIHSLLPENKKKLIIKTLRNKNLKLAVFITKSLLEQYDKIYHSDKYIIEPGASPIFENNIEIIENTCGYVGSFHEGKGIEVICQLATKMPNNIFHIIGGSDSQIRKLQQKYNIGENVVWYGYRPYSEATELMRKVDIALLPNQEKVVVGNTDIGKFTSPNKMFEYMSMGKAIVASKVAALEEILINEKNALLVDPKDIIQWENAINRIISDKKLKEDICNNNREIVISHYNWIERANRVISKLNKE